MEPVRKRLLTSGCLSFAGFILLIIGLDSGSHWVAATGILLVVAGTVSGLPVLRQKYRK
jgi:hypothetical protein